MTDSRSFQHIVKNFSLYGFSDPIAGLLQSIKEFVENSVDAIKDADTATDGNITLSVTCQPGKPYCVSLTCDDNGCGMNDPSKLLELFSTTKENGSARRAGRFGVGLSASLLYSLVESARFGGEEVPMRIVTKDRARTTALIADYGMKFDGTVSVVQCTEAAAPVGGFQSASFTRVSICLPLLRRPPAAVAAAVGSGEAEAAAALDTVFSAVECFLARMVMLPSFPYTVTVHVDTPALRRADVFLGHPPVHAPLSADTYRERLLRRVQEALPEGEMCDHAATWLQSDDESDFECTASVQLVLRDVKKAAAVAAAAAAVDARRAAGEGGGGDDSDEEEEDDEAAADQRDRDRDRGGGDEEEGSARDGSFAVDLWRYCNGGTSSADYPPWYKHRFHVRVVGRAHAGLR
jgi:hypothetical protein